MAPDFGPNVHIFDVSMTGIQSQIANLFPAQDGGVYVDQFGAGRHAFFFKPHRRNEKYELDVKLGYYTTIHGLGDEPDDVTIRGGVQTLGVGDKGLALNNFWRGAENLAVIATGFVGADRVNKWAVSQATFLRRFHLQDDAILWLFDVVFPNPDAGMSSGGFIANSKIERKVISGSQQQFLTRNTALGEWSGYVWNMVFVGDEEAPTESWPGKPITVVDTTPKVREKPYLVYNDGTYKVRAPSLKHSSRGPDWTSSSTTTVSIDRFYIAKQGDTAGTINAQLNSGQHLILTPGIYQLSDSLQVTHADTIIFGLGMATLVASNGKPALTIADVDGVSISGIIIDAGPQQSPSLLVIGPSTSAVDHSANPTTLHDVSVRVGGMAPGLAKSCVTINANDVILDNVWIWRADHDSSGLVYWTMNEAENGLIVNGDRVTAYGLFVEHFQGFQTLWNGNGGSVYFYQSELPYDVPSQTAWQQNGDKGYPSYKVKDTVTSHRATGLGIYSFFRDTAGVQLDNAIETPTRPDIKMNHMVTQWLNGATGTSINHIINDTGDRVDEVHKTARSPN